MSCCTNDCAHQNHPQQHWHVGPLSPLPCPPSTRRQLSLPWSLSPHAVEPWQVRPEPPIPPQPFPHHHVGCPPTSSASTTLFLSVFISLLCLSGLLKLPSYFCFSLTSPLQALSLAKNGDGVPALFRLLCSYIRCLVSGGLNQNKILLPYSSKILYYSKTTWLINSWKTK